MPRSGVAPSAARSRVAATRATPLTRVAPACPACDPLPLAPAPEQKWSKGKVKEKLQNLVLFDKNTYEKLLSDIPKNKLITPSIVSEKLKVNGSLARKAVKELMAKGLTRVVSHHHAQSIYTRASH